MNCSLFTHAFKEKTHIPYYKLNQGQFGKIFSKWVLNIKSGPKPKEQKIPQNNWPTSIGMSGHKTQRKLRNCSRPKEAEEM